MSKIARISNVEKVLSVTEKVGFIDKNSALKYLDMSSGVLTKVISDMRKMTNHKVRRISLVNSITGVRYSKYFVD